MNEPTGKVLLAVSDEMTQLYKEQFGRGPARARAYMAGDDLLVVALEDTLSPAERRLRNMGELQRLRDTRLFFQHATEEELSEIVERLTGRTVRGFVSGIDARQDISLEAFFLEPRRAPGDA